MHAVLKSRCSFGPILIAHQQQVEYLAGYLEAERDSRDASRRAQLLRRCGLPAPKTFDGYDWSAVSWPDGLGREDLLCLIASKLRV